MKFLFDLFPVLTFFAIFQWANKNIQATHAFLTRYFSDFISGNVIPIEQAPIMLATLVMVVISIIQIAYLILRKKKVDTLLWLSLIVVGVLGGLTIYLHSESFIKWKPSVLYWLFGFILIVSYALFDKNLIRNMMQEQIKLPEFVWAKLLFSWIIFFVLMGIINLFVAFNFSTAAWVNFKLFGGIGLVLVFAIGQSVFLSRYIQEEK
jgi:intracellular septation protein